MGRQQDREGVVEPILHVLHWRAELVFGPDADGGGLARPPVVAHDGGAIASVHDAAVGLDRRLSALATADPLPGDGAAGGPARHREVRVVVLGGVDPIGKLIVDSQAEQASRWLIVYRRPRGASVQRDGGAPVVAFDHPVGVFRIDPHRVMVAVGHGQGCEGCSSVRRFPKPIGLHIHGVRILRVGDHVGVGPGVAPPVGLLEDALPRLAAVIRAEQGAIVRLDHRPDAARACRRDRDADLPDNPPRQTWIASNVRPGVATVGRLVQAAVGPSADRVPRKTLQLIERRVEHIGVRRIHREVERARPLAFVKDLLPGLATIGRAIDTPLGVGPEDIARRRHIDEVRIRGMNPDLRDVPGFPEPYVGPRPSAVVDL